jgi:hypothetical protein
MKYDIVIGIDCDVEKSGLAYLETDTRRLEVDSYTFPELIGYLQFLKKRIDEEKEKPKAIVVVEAGWLNHISNYHTAAGRAGQRIAKNVGANHQVGKLIVEMAKHYGFEVIEQAPLKKCWKGRDGKITHEELASFTGLMGKTNQDARDATLMAWVYAGFPIKVKTI